MVQHHPTSNLATPNTPRRSPWDILCQDSRSCAFLGLNLGKPFNLGPPCRTQGRKTAQRNCRRRALTDLSAPLQDARSHKCPNPKTLAHI